MLFNKLIWIYLYKYTLNVPVILFNIVRIFPQNNILFSITHNTKGQEGILNIEWAILNTGCETPG